MCNCCYNYVAVYYNGIKEIIVVENLYIIKTFVSETLKWVY